MKEDCKKDKTGRPRDSNVMNKQECNKDAVMSRYRFKSAYKIDYIEERRASCLHIGLLTIGSLLTQSTRGLETR